MGVRVLGKKERERISTTWTKGKYENKEMMCMYRYLSKYIMIEHF